MSTFLMTHHFQRYFEQHAAGEFLATVVPGTNHCGIDDHNATFRFEVKIDYHNRADALDSQGFLLDNTDFQRYFDNLGPISVSCEMVAAQAAEHFLELLGDRADCVKAIAVSLYPFGQVAVQVDIEAQ